MVARWEFGGGACVVATSCAMLMANKSRWIYKSCCYWSFMEKEEAIRRWRRVGRHRRIGGGCAHPSPATWSDINLVIKEEALHWSPAGFLLPDNTLGYACIQASQLSLFARVFLKVCNESFFGSEKKNWGQSKFRRRRRPTHSNHQHLQQSIANCNYYNRSHIFY